MLIMFAKKLTGFCFLRTDLFISEYIALRVGVSTDSIFLLKEEVDATTLGDLKTAIELLLNKGDNGVRDLVLDINPTSCCNI